MQEKWRDQEYEHMKQQMRDSAGDIGSCSLLQLQNTVARYVRRATLFYLRLGTSPKIYGKSSSLP